MKKNSTQLGILKINNIIMWLLNTNVFVIYLDKGVLFSYFFCSLTQCCLLVKDTCDQFYFTLKYMQR